MHVLAYLLIGVVVVRAVLVHPDIRREIEEDKEYIGPAFVGMMASFAVVLWPLVVAMAVAALVFKFIGELI